MLDNNAMPDVPVAVVSEVAEAIGPMLRPPFYDTLTAENQAFWDAGISRQVEHFLAVPAVAAAFEAQAKLEAAVGLLKEARQAYEGHGVGDPAVCDDCAFVARIDALLVRVEEGGESS